MRNSIREFTEFSCPRHTQTVLKINNLFLVEFGKAGQLQEYEYGGSDWRYVVTVAWKFSLKQIYYCYVNTVLYETRSLSTSDSASFSEQRGGRR